MKYSIQMLFTANIMTLVHIRCDLPLPPSPGKYIIKARISYSCESFFCFEGFNVLILLLQFFFYVNLNGVQSFENQDYGTTMYSYVNLLYHRINLFYLTNIYIF